MIEQWSPAISAHPSTMAAKKIILQEPDPPNLTIASRKMGETMIQMEAIRIALQEGTGGRVLYITNTLPLHQINLITTLHRGGDRSFNTIYGNKMVIILEHSRA
jgi:hypothetical protein